MEVKAWLVKVLMRGPVMRKKIWMSGCTAGLRQRPKGTMKSVTRMTRFTANKCGSDSPIKRSYKNIKRVGENNYQQFLLLKIKIMLQNKTILSLTSDLLANNAFNHLRDAELSALHCLILKLREPLTTIQQNLLLTFWNHAYTGDLPAPLLHRCNTILQQLGRSPMEMMELQMEMY